MSNEYSQGPDYWSKRAHQEGYPARSVYKLKEIDERFRLIKRGMRVLDLGASPGSWSLYVLKRLGGSGTLVAVDLKPVSLKGSFAGFEFIQGDLLDLGLAGRLGAGGRFELILSDAAPDTTGNRTVDTGRSITLVRGVISLAQGLLLPGGCLVVKLFQGGEEQSILKEFRELFEVGKSFKPKASRKSSFESYCIGTGWRGGAPVGPGEAT